VLTSSFTLIRIVSLAFENVTAICDLRSNDVSCYYKCNFVFAFVFSFVSLLAVVRNF